MRLELQLNGAPWHAEVEPSDSLLDALRRNGHTEVKAGCGVGVCGACTVIVDNRIASSCLYVAAIAAGREVWTAEGLVADDPSIAAAFSEREGFQCGACTPGQVVASWAYTHLGPGSSDEQEIRHFMSGNLCRCTGYAQIVEAVRQLCDD